MQKLAAILGTLFLFLGFLHPVWQGQQLNQHRKDIKKQIRNQNIQAENIDTLIFEETSIGTISAEDEIEVNGMMYDVLSVQHTPKGLKVIAFRDAKEKQLLNFISQRIQKEIPWSTSPNFKASNNLFTEEFSPFEFENSYIVVRINRVDKDSCSLGFVRKQSQPPELHFS